MLDLEIKAQKAYETFAIEKLFIPNTMFASSKKAEGFYFGFIKGYEEAIVRSDDGRLEDDPTRTKRIT